jgi:aryl-alcohol dehydrogenase-like predicted oxidoreductase
MLKKKIKIILGGAQLGLKYGLLKKKLNNKLVHSIIKSAIKNKVFTIDTANNYGSSEKNIGSFLNLNKKKKIRIITKLYPFRNYNTNLNLKKRVEESVKISLNNLKIKKIDTLLVHKASNVFQSKKLIWKYLIQLKKKKKIKKIGISIQNQQELELALKLKEISVIQLPLNILDNRWNKYIDKIIKLKKKKNLEIHARSIFLQGLLINRNQRSWKRTRYKGLNIINKWLVINKKLFKRKSVVDLCFSYVKSQEWIDGIVIGVDNLIQLKNNIMLYKFKKLKPCQLALINSSRPKVNNVLLNPKKWRK